MPCSSTLCGIPILIGNVFIHRGGRPNEYNPADGKSLGYADIESAIKLAQENEGSTVKLMSEGVSESITVTGGKFTVDFNGKMVFYQFAVSGGDVTFTSSVKQDDVENLISEITVNGADAKVTIDGKIKLGSVTLSSGTLTVNSTDGYINPPRPSAP